MSKFESALNVRLSADQWAFIRDVCEREGMQSSELIRDAIMQYEENRSRNQRMELFANMVSALHKEGAPPGEAFEEFKATYIDEFETARQIDDFLSMPPQVIEAAIRDAWRRFEPTGDVEAWSRERGEYEFEKKTKKEKSR